MARILQNQTNAFPPDLTYPYGDIKDDTGAADGVPVDRDVYADHHQFFARLVDQATNPAIVLNDLPDNAANGFQLYASLLATKTTLALTNETNIIKLKNQVLGLMCGDFSSF